MYDITVGDEYWISKLNGEQWEDMPTNIVWNDLGIQIRAVKVASQIARALDNCIYKIFDLDETEEYLCTGCECDNRQ